MEGNTSVPADVVDLFNQEARGCVVFVSPSIRVWSEEDINHMLWSIDSNASLELIAERLGRTATAVRSKLRDLGYTAESLGGYKV